MPYEMHETPPKPLPNFHTGCTVLGRRGLAEALVEWSKKKPSGAKFVKETNWGLVLTFIANLAEPLVLVSLSVAGLRRFLAQWGPTSRILVESYGFQLLGPIDKNQREALLSEHTPVAVVHATTVEDNCRVLFQFWPGTTTEEDRLLGIISLTENGFFWLTAQEAEKFVAEGNITVEKNAPQPQYAKSSAKTVNYALERLHNEMLTQQEAESSQSCDLQMSAEELAACERL